MAQYFLDGTNISTLGVIPAPRYIKDIALKGAFDFPKRDGETEKDWGDSVEAFVDNEDLEWKEKVIELRVFVQGSSNSDLSNKIVAFSNACLNASLLTSSYGLNYDVRLVGGVDVKTHVLSKTAFCEAKFNVLNPIISGSYSTKLVPLSGYCLDFFRFNQDLSLFVIERDGNKDIPRYNPVETTVSYQTPITVREPRDISLKVYMKASDLSDLLVKMGKLHAYLSSNGLKSLRFPDGTTHDVYVKDGFSINRIYTWSEVIAVFYLKFREPSPL